MKSGVIFGNRSFFADELCLDGRRRLLECCKRRVSPVIRRKTWSLRECAKPEQALKCAALFKEHDDLKE